MASGMCYAIGCDVYKNYIHGRRRSQAVSTFCCISGAVKEWQLYGKLNQHHVEKQHVFVQEGRWPHQYN